MTRLIILLLLIQTLLAGSLIAQTGDTPAKKVDSVPPARVDTAKDSSFKIKRIRPVIDSYSRQKSDTLQTDTTAVFVLKDTGWVILAEKFPRGSFIRNACELNKFFGFSSLPVSVKSDKKEFKGKEILFYTILALLLLFAFIKISFPKYLGDLYQVAFRTTLKQRQMSEQLVQTPLPSLLLNFFFIISASLYIDFILLHYQMTARYGFWLLFLYCFVALAVIYAIKFLSLKFFGWLFNISSVTDGYIFIVFMINKIIGAYLLPFLILMAFTDSLLYEVAFTLSYIGVFGLLAYRFILSYGLLRSQIRVNPFHFFLYLCAFELVPLLLIYKALLHWF